MNTRLLILLFSAITVLAPSSRALEFRLLSWSGSLEDLKYSNGSRVVEIMAGDSSLSPKYQFTGTGPLVLFREIKQDDKIVRQPVASLSPPEGFTHAILVLTAADDAGTHYVARWINDSPEVRKAQTITYENLSSYSVAIKLGEEELTLAPLERLTRPTNSSRMRLTLKVAAQKGGGWELVSSSSQPIRPGLRTLVILRDGRLANGVRSTIDYLSFNDLPPPPTPPALP